MINKEFISKFTLIPLSILFSFCILESFTRLFIKPPPVIRIENLQNQDESKFKIYNAPTLEDGTIILENIPDFGLYLYTPTGTRLKKNAKAILKNHPFGVPEVEIRTNSLGFRHAELGKKDKEERRILVLGDSITLGDWLPDNQTYPAQVNKYLREMKQKEGKPQKIDVINAGVGSIDIQNEYAILMENGLAVDPDDVIVGLYLNDAFESPTLNITKLPSYLRHSYFLRVVFDRIDKLRAFFKAKQWQSSSKRALNQEGNKFLQSHTELKNNHLVFKNIFYKEVFENFNDWGYAWSDDYWDRIMQIIELMQETAEYQNFRLAIVLFPVAQQVQYPALINEPQQRFEIEMQERNIPHLDLLPLLRDKFIRDKRNVFYDNCHYNQEGNEFVGREIAKFMVNNGLI